MTDPPDAPWLAANLDALAAALETTVDAGTPGRWHLTSTPDGPVLQLQTAGGRSSPRTAGGSRPPKRTASSTPRSAADRVPRWRW